MLDMCRVVYLALIVLNAINFAQSSVKAIMNEYELLARRMKLLRGDDINFDLFLSYARPY